MAWVKVRCGPALALLRAGRSHAFQTWGGGFQVPNYLLPHISRSLLPHNLLTRSDLTILPRPVPGPPLRLARPLCLSSPCNFICSAWSWSRAPSCLSLVRPPQQAYRLREPQAMVLTHCTDSGGHRWKRANRTLLSQVCDRQYPFFLGFIFCCSNTGFSGLQWRVVET